MAVGVAAEQVLAVQPAAARSRCRKLSPSLTIGIGLLVVIIAACIIGPFFLPDPTALNLLNAGEPPFSPGHLLGTDEPFGRDILSRLLSGGRIDLFIGFAATSVTLVSGTLLGLISGYAGKLVDTVIMRVVDVFFAFPFFVLVLAIVAMLGQGLLSILIAIWAIGWVSYARIIRGETLVAREQEYVIAARALGYNPVRIMLRHILPNVVSAAVIFAMVDAIANIVLAASLGFLGSGVPDPAAEWGKMIAANQDFLSTAPWISILPGLCIIWVGVALSLVGDGLAQRLRPER